MNQESLNSWKSPPSPCFGISNSLRVSCQEWKFINHVLAARAHIAVKLCELRARRWFKIPHGLGESALPHCICSSVAGSDDTWAAVSLVVCLLETTWQADILQINEERLSISSGIRHSFKQRVMSLHTVSIFFGAENLLSCSRSTWQTSL